MPFRTRHLAILLLLAIPAGPAFGDDWQNCNQSSFAPLDIDIPACTRIIDSGELADEKLVVALMSRGKAYLFAQTYRGEHKIDAAQLLASAAVDFDRAVAIIRKGGSKLHGLLREALSERAGLFFMRGKPEEAARDHSEILKVFGGRVTATLLGRALAMTALRRYDEAIADMNALIRIADDTSNFHNMIFVRGEIHEAAGDLTSAIEDFRRTLKLDPKHGAAAQALKRLGALP